jgi:hypothetical protein
VKVLCSFCYPHSSTLKKIYMYIINEGFSISSISHSIFIAQAAALFQKMRRWDFEVPKLNLRVKRIENACHSSDNRQRLQKRSLRQFASIEMIEKTFSLKLLNVLIRYFMELNQNLNEPKSKTMWNKETVLFRHIDSMSKKIFLTDTATKWRI